MPEKNLAAALAAVPTGWARTSPDPSRWLAGLTLRRANKLSVHTRSAYVRRYFGRTFALRRPRRPGSLPPALKQQHPTSWRFVLGTVPCEWGRALGRVCIWLFDEQIDRSEPLRIRQGCDPPHPQLIDLKRKRAVACDPVEIALLVN